MKKKFSFYCSMLGAVLAIYLLNCLRVQHWHYGSTGDEPQLEFTQTPAEFYLSNDTVYHEGGMSVNSHQKSQTIKVYVRPKRTSDDRALISRTDGQVYRIKMREVELDVPYSQKSAIPTIAVVITGVISVVVIIWIVIMVFRIFRRMGKEGVFVTQVSKSMETTGILLTALYLFQSLSNIIIGDYLAKHIVLAEYAVISKNDANIMFILTGLALMIISQIILMGKDLKEEQDLTI
ncbi:MAG: DUF2975 domain-containing protein [Bacteroidaceae bacterium]|nr:DUF2975 domain-containing protein [Bacteroidaceae bacterium]